MIKNDQTLFASPSPFPLCPSSPHGVVPTPSIFSRHGHGYRSTVISADHWFSFISIDIKGCLGTVAKVDIQDRIAKRINLGIIFRLARQARHADPNTFRPPNDLMRRTYGLTVVTNTWQMYVMLAESNGDDDLLVDSYVSRVRGNGRETMAELTETKTMQTVIQLDYGSLSDPSSLLKLISYLRRFRNEASVRQNFIGNWLYCLRDHGDAEFTSPKRRKITTETADAEQRTESRGRGRGRDRSGRGGRGNGGYRGSSRGRGGRTTQMTIDRNRKAPIRNNKRGLPGVTAVHREIAFSNRKYVEEWVERCSTAGSDELS